MVARGGEDMTRETSPTNRYGESNVRLKPGGTHLTRQTLDHGLPLLLRLIRPPTSTKQSLKILTIMILRIILLSALCSFVQRAFMWDRCSGTVASKVAFREELELFVVGVAGYGARRADTAG